MNNDSSLSHSRWEYHVVWIPKYRRKTLYGELRKYLGQIFKDLARSRESEIIEGHMIKAESTNWLCFFYFRLPYQFCEENPCK